MDRRLHGSGKQLSGNPPEPDAGRSQDSAIGGPDTNALVAVGEADVRDWSGSFLTSTGKPGAFGAKASLVSAVESTTPRESAWHALIIARNRGRPHRFDVVDQPGHAIADQGHIVDQARHFRMGRMVDRPQPSLGPIQRPAFPWQHAVAQGIHRLRRGDGLELHVG